LIIGAQATKEPGCATLVRVPIHSVIDIFGAEVRPDSEYGAAGLVAEMSARRAGRAPITMGVATSAAAVNSITSQRADMAPLPVGCT
jgi:hypothetical protein